ncbi:MAG: FtsX-like permease family protein [bacterium]|nr:FtsX-like permease family protein [bacterium]
MDRLYQTEERSAKVVACASILAVAIACMGLFVLAVLTVVWRTKEIGIRKVLGASTMGVAFLVIREFLWLVVMANLFAWPFAYWAMHRWLQNYPYRVEIGSELFVLAGALSFCIALLTVGYQAIRAARANPVEALRYE